MARVDATELIGHWNTMVEGLATSSDEFYRDVERRIGAHRLKDVRIERVELREGGVFSAKREYLQVRRDEFVLHVCAAPFGNGFFVSWWFGSVEKGLLAWLKKIPLIGFFVRWLITPWTYYRVDTANMFNAIAKGAVIEALDDFLAAQGLRALSPEEKKPVMKELLR